MNMEPAHDYIKPDAVYPGIYEGLPVLAGVREVRNFWHSIVECRGVRPWIPWVNMHARASIILQWLRNAHSLTASISVPITTKYGRAIIHLLGATRVGHLDDAYITW